MNFRTEFTVKTSETKIELKDSIITTGSCFSDDIGQKLMDNKFKVARNPFGTVYNPISIHYVLRNALLNENPSPNSFIERDGIFYHYDFHSDWYGKTKSELHDKLVTQIKDVHKQMAECRFLMLTYGTSWVYEERELKTVVANCHKIPQTRFDKYLLTQKRILESFEQFHSVLKRANNNVGIILTVSPVRHLKDTIELNSVSKSILRLTCHTLSQIYPDVVYFPSYEIMMDDLRDYRFYKPDLIHPSETAVDYIWEKFTKAYLSDSAKGFIKEWSKIKSAMAHRPFHPEGHAHQQFLRETIVTLSQLCDQVDVQQEITHLKNQLV